MRCTQIAFGGLLAWAALAGRGQLARAEGAAQVELRVEEIHAWRPPFGVERVGQGRAVVVEAAGEQRGKLVLTALLAGKEVAHQEVQVPEKLPRVTRVVFEGLFDMDEVVLTRPGAPGGAASELGRIKVHLPPLEADAVARPEEAINPVDLGAILVPSDWLLLGPGQAGRLTVRAVERGDAKKTLTVKAWFESAPATSAATALALSSGQRGEVNIDLPHASAEKDILHIALQDGEKEVWKKSITTMRVHAAPALPKFGAVAMKLRYDAPISMKDTQTGAFSGTPYEGAWDARLNDVVICLPNGSRYVFWRGSSYIPFWAGKHNTGLSYEWAERISGAPGATDCVEPLMDKQLRYGRVQIIESTPARVHVRWTYQSTDLLYKVWGDQAVEDYYFYPDGFGTRVLSLKRDPAAHYELSELIVLTPQETYPFSVLPTKAVDLIYTDAQKHSMTFPSASNPVLATLGPQRDLPAVYRVRIHKDDTSAAVYFNPRSIKLPEAIFAPFSDHGEVVTPAYWGSHWPLARGKSTGWSVDDRVHFTPCHNSLLTWQSVQPEPIETRQGLTIDSLGKSRVMVSERWAWLIAMSDADDNRLVQWGQSYGKPPSIEAKGALVSFEGSIEERRAIRLEAESPSITMKLTPSGRWCVNPVFEIEQAGGKLKSVSLDHQPLDASHYAWDGHVLWLDATFEKPIEVALEFEAK